MATKYSELIRSEAHAYIYNLLKWFCTLSRVFVFKNDKESTDTTIFEKIRMGYSTTTRDWFAAAKCNTDLKQKKAKQLFIVTFGQHLKA